MWTHLLRSPSESRNLHCSNHLRPCRLQPGTERLQPAQQPGYCTRVRRRLIRNASTTTPSVPATIRIMVTVSTLVLLSLLVEVLLKRLRHHDERRTQGYE